LSNRDQTEAAVDVVVVEDVVGEEEAGKTIESASRRSKRAIRSLSGIIMMFWDYLRTNCSSFGLQ
jgi:hypothetical protein